MTAQEITNQNANAFREQTKAHHLNKPPQLLTQCIFKRPMNVEPLPDDMRQKLTGKAV